MERLRLTDGSVAALEPQDKRYDKSDGLRIGLWIRVTPTGVKTWIFEKRIRGGALRSHTLGRSPVVSLSEALEKPCPLRKKL
ncbi:Arm DNA-binding domain-containing protein [Paracoccus saliphilus]|uniref:DUF4102 domain-containing protein n=1 Tax=Paracoccus saliphilus TaxID=405559 RepID=A0AA46A6Z5_9RHOB|nr:Arm DNA-binding domain-containing protein [Paracoccus saliphilus]WCR03843.1 DUF4102 domain-containing protein [Paracoccus saliphilus]SIT05309.1 protein of unknown function [Paracoccus saliphilus]